MDLFSCLQQSFSKIQDQIKNTEAENTSSYSDILLWKFNGNLYQKARDTKLLVIAIAFMGLPDDQQNRIRQRAHKIAEFKNYQGEWAEVEELLQLQHNIPGKILTWYLTKHSIEAWFGNDLKRIIKIIATARTFNPYLPTKKPVKKPQRKRGYNDKGSLSSVDKLTLEHWKKRRTITKITDIEKTPFYPKWYAEEKNKHQDALRVEKAFPDSEGGD